MWEVSVINKQKFLAELAKLLTFMYEDDRQRALGAYNDMFEEAEDEQALLQALVSPLRQAVEVARAYNAGKATFGEPVAADSEERTQHFMETIFRIRAEALSTQPVAETVDEDQISLFDPDAEPAEEAPAPAAEAEGEAPAASGEEAPEEGEAPAGGEAAPAAEAAPAPVPAAEPEEEEEDEEEDEIAVPRRTVRKCRVPLLILYLIFAIPLTLIGVVVLLVPALASLAAAIACVVVAVLAITSAFGSFPKIANLLVALGAALILLAVGLLFLMLFIWLLGGAIGGLIHGVITLGGKWCYKEVAAE